MSHDVFISHSTKDHTKSNSIYNYLKSNGIKCFMDTYDLIPGISYPVQLANAIKESRVVLLIFSASSDTSGAVQNEIGLAFNNKIPIFPVRIENILPDELAIFITTSQWLDIFPPPIERHFPKLIEAIIKFLNPNPPTVPKPKVNDKYWHTIDYKDLPSWIRKYMYELKTGKYVKGRTFIYRQNRISGKIERKLIRSPAN